MARFKSYKVVADYNEWRKDNPNTEVYAITTFCGDFLFDVTESDFIEMVDKGLVNSEGNYYLLTNDTDKEVEEFAAKYGILWTDREKCEELPKVYVFTSCETYNGNNKECVTKAYYAKDNATYAFLQWKVDVLSRMVKECGADWDITTNTDDHFNAYGYDSTNNNVYGKVEEITIN